MCMGTNLGKAALKRYRAKGKNGYIRVWKVVRKSGYRYISIWIGHVYEKGFTHAHKKAQEEQRLIHAFRDESSAKNWASSYELVIECMIRPSWITAVGISSGLSGYNKKTLTTKAIVMPEFPKTKVTVREFRAAVKGKKVKTYSWE